MISQAISLVNLLSLCLLITTMKRTRSVVGISFKTHELSLLSHVVQLFISNSLLMVLLELLYVLLVLYLLNLAHNEEPFRSEYSALEVNYDSFSHWKLLVLPAFLLAIITNFLEESYIGLSYRESSDEIRFHETVSCFATFLNAVTYVPQVLLISKHKEIENIGLPYVLSLVSQIVLCVLIFLFFYLFIGSDGFADNPIPNYPGANQLEVVNSLASLLYLTSLSPLLPPSVSHKFLSLTSDHLLYPSNDCHSLVLSYFL